MPVAMNAHAGATQLEDVMVADQTAVPDGAADGSPASATSSEPKNGVDTVRAPALVASFPCAVSS